MYVSQRLDEKICDNATIKQKIQFIAEKQIKFKKQGDFNMCDLNLLQTEDDQDSRMNYLKSSSASYPDMDFDDLMPFVYNWTNIKEGLFSVCFW